MAHSPAVPPSAGLPDAVARIAAAAQPIVVSDERVVGLYLFGSQANGEAHAGSDVDLGVLFASPVEVWDLLGLQARLEEALGADVDLVDISKASAFLALDIIRGERLYCADADACDELELYVLRRAADLAPFERLRRRMALGRAVGDGEAA